MSELNSSCTIPPKECRACGKMYCDLHQYIWDTEAKAQTIEDAGEVMGKAFTMLYRNCSCGNTLVLTLTSDNFPQIVDFWIMISKEAESRNESVKETVLSFMRDWESSLKRNHPGLKKRRSGL
jgi:hypothetical protein